VEYLDHAPLLMSEYLGQEEVELFLAHTGSSRTQNAFALAGAQPSPVGDWSTAAYIITEPRGFSRSNLRSKRVPLAGLLSQPAGLAVSLKERFTAPSIPQNDLDVTRARDFDQRFEIFWEILGHRTDTLLAIRSREALKWRFGAALESNRLWIFVAARNSNIDGYAVFERCDDPVSGLKRMRMADFQACDWQDQYCAAFIQRAYDDCRAEGIHVLEHIGCGLPKMRVFDESAPYRRSIPNSSLIYFTRNAELAEHLSHPESWTPFFYDTGAICS
jgi:hypothetical protein